MVDWLAGKRVRGTSSERTPLGVTLGGTGVGGWVELGRYTEGTGGVASFNVSSLADKRYYMILTHSYNGGAPDAEIAYRFGNSSVDTGTNYAVRYNVNGGTDATNTSLDYMRSCPGDTSRSNSFTVGYIANRSANEKLLITQNVNDANSTGAGNAPHRAECVNKWTNTSNPIDVIQTFRGGSNSGTFGIGAETVVLGWDPADSHTNNFWEELGSHELSAESNQLDVSGMTAKKYLWYQAFIKKDATANNYAEHSINGITTGNTWARRLSSDGGADGTSTSQNTMNTTDTGAGGYFENGFIINNDGKEKLFIVHLVQNLTAGAGTTPQRKEIVMKSTTSAQITQLTITGATNGYEAGSILKVWGAN